MKGSQPARGRAHAPLSAHYGCFHFGQTRPRQGQSLPEFAVVVPFLLLLIFILIDLARLIQAQVTVNNAARQAIRWAITGQQERDPITNAWIPRPTSIARRARDGLAGLPLSNTNDPTQFGFYQVDLNPPDGGVPNEYVEVHVYYNVRMLTPFASAIWPNVLVQGVERAVNEEWGAVQSF